jgi:hypothetical protein
MSAMCILWRNAETAEAVGYINRNDIQWRQNIEMAAAASVA